MPNVGELFHAAFGPPNPAVEDGLPHATPYWPAMKDHCGAGYFLDRYLYLFGTGLERLHACLDAWSFIVPPRTPGRTILGYNAHGCIVVLEDPKSVEVRVLHPLVVQYWGDPSLDFVSLIGRGLARRELPLFFDTSVYEAWRAESGRYLAPGRILGMGVPLSLDGEMTLGNFAEQDIVEYYEQAAPAYAEAFASMKGK
jgi:hypothetical protein